MAEPTPDLAAVVTEIERLLDLSGNYHRRIQYTDWNTTTPQHLIDCFSHTLRESYAVDPSARFWWVETGEEGSPLIVGYLGNGPSSELNALLLGAGPSIVAELRAAQADLAALREQLQDAEASMTNAMTKAALWKLDNDALRERLVLATIAREARNEAAK